MPFVSNENELRPCLRLVPYLVSRMQLFSQYFNCCERLINFVIWFLKDGKKCQLKEFNWIVMRKTNAGIFSHSCSIVSQYIWLILRKNGFSECLQVLSLVCPWYQELHPSHPGHWVTVLCLPLSSAFIMIIIVSRGLIQLARAKWKQCTYLLTGGVSK